LEIRKGFDFQFCRPDHHIRMTKQNKTARISAFTNGESASSINKSSLLIVKTAAIIVNGITKIAPSAIIRTFGWLTQKFLLRNVVIVLSSAGMKIKRT